MKTRCLSLGVVGGLALFAALGVARGQGFYVGANMGPAIGEDVDINRFVGPTPGLKFELNPGVRLSAVGGYNFNDFIGVQLETGFIYNDIDELNHGGNIDGALMHVPLLVNAVFRYDRPNCKWIPYVGIGAGGDVSETWLDNVRVGNVNVDGFGSDLVFAWQAFAGLRYRITENISVGGGYKYFWADGASWDVEHTSSDIESDKAVVHSFIVDFTWKF
jgi:opacity protein-like surface antigen